MTSSHEMKDSTNTCHHINVSVPDRDFTFPWKYNVFLKQQNLVWFGLVLGFMMFNATFNNISVISWRSVLLVEETGIPGENYSPAASHRQTLSHDVVNLALVDIRTHNISGDRHRLHR